MIDLTAAGLTATESKCYAALLEQKEWKPAELAQAVHETRTNCYKILDNLVALQLAERFDKAKKLHYRATNPARLLELARTAREVRETAEKELEIYTRELTQTYFQSNEQPGVQYFQGEQELAQVFEAIAGATEEVVFIHTTAGIDFYGFEMMHNLRMLAPNAGVSRRALTPDGQHAPRDYKTTDPTVLLNRTWLKKDDYTAPVEWGAFDDKLYIISYGSEAMGMLIESAQVASAFKQLFALIERGQKLLPNYTSLPTYAAATAATNPKL